MALEGKMADAYYAFRKQIGNNFNRYQTFSSDETTGLSLDGDYYDAVENINPTLHTFQASDAPLNWWSDLAGGITKCNKLISELSASDNATADEGLRS